VVGTITQKLAPVLKTVYDQMTEPKWVVAFGACTVSGGIYDNYAVVQGIDEIIPVDIYIPGCPPRPETVLDGLLKLHEKIRTEGQDWRWRNGRPDGLAGAFPRHPGNGRFVRCPVVRLGRQLPARPRF
jgi:NADH:ubiquinone oxidoreductase subunit B-like Fe-S oxidoreductase